MSLTKGKEHPTKAEFYVEQRYAALTKLKKTSSRKGNKHPTTTKKTTSKGKH